MKKLSFLPITIVLPVYYADSPRFLEEALNSILDLEAYPSECIIGFDGKVPNEIRSIVKTFMDSSPFKCVLYESATNIGLGLMLNELVDRSQFDIIARMDADDLCRPNRLSVQYQLMIEQNLDICGGQIQEFCVEPGDISWNKVVPCEHESIIKMLKYKSPFTHPTICFRKSIFISVGGFIRLPPIEDYDFFVRCALAGASFGNCIDIILDFRVGESFAMIQRRRGIAYFKREIYLYYILFFRKYKYYNIFDLLRVLPKTVLRLMPVWFLYIFYVIVRR